mgnify:CR=1 FL=1
MRIAFQARRRIGNADLCQQIDDLAAIGGAATTSAAVPMYCGKVMSAVDNTAKGAALRVLAAIALGVAEAAEDDTRVVLRGWRFERRGPTDPTAGAGNQNATSHELSLKRFCYDVGRAERERRDRQRRVAGSHRREHAGPEDIQIVVVVRTQIGVDD